MCPVRPGTMAWQDCQHELKVINAFKDHSLSEFAGKKVSYDTPVKTVDDDHKTYKIKASDTINSIAERIYNSYPEFKTGKKEQQIANIVDDLMAKNSFLRKFDDRETEKEIKSDNYDYIPHYKTPLQRLESHQKENKLEKGSSKAFTKLDF